MQELLGTGDTDLGIPFAGYVPRKLFAGRLQQRDLRVDPPISNVVVPDRESLALVKLAALRDRSLAYRALEDGATMALLDPSRANLIRALSQGYFLRKAGKDLFDMSVLVPEKRQIAECLALADRHGILDAIRRWLGKVPAPILDFASDAAARTEQSDPAAWLRRVAEATP
ncbi:MAG TPA: hypothetical protein VM681_03690 [Candidatus Thermoplasmatota archaeon]|nr:hypothetical protein [Candidatus Thermoplasmatota archaeon]